MYWNLSLAATSRVNVSAVNPGENHSTDCVFPFVEHRRAGFSCVASSTRLADEPVVEFGFRPWTIPAVEWSSAHADDDQARIGLDSGLDLRKVGLQKGSTSWRIACQPPHRTVNRLKTACSTRQQRVPGTDLDPLALAIELPTLARSLFLPRSQFQAGPTPHPAVTL
jgi:hypothetical protein